MNIIKIILVLLVTFISMCTDIKEHKIKNKILSVFLLLGIILSAFSNGISGIKDSLLGIIIPFAIFIVFFAIGLFGAGDIKLFCTIGAIMGKSFAENNIIYSFLLSGICVICVLIYKRQLIEKVKKIFNYFKMIFICRNVTTMETNKEEKFPFAAAIFLGTLVQVILRYRFV